jgi:hypothetical protein
MAVKHFKYKHYKGGVVTVLEIGTHTETGEEIVTYSDDKTGAVWCRPGDIFADTVTLPDGSIVERFEIMD